MAAMTQDQVNAAFQKDLNQIQKALDYVDHRASIPDPDTPSIWQLMGQHAGSMVDQAIQQAGDGLTLGGGVVDDLRQRITDLLYTPLDHLAAWHRNGLGNHSVNEEVDDAVSAAVGQALNEVNVTNITGNSSDFGERLVKILDREIEIDVINTIISNSTQKLKEANANDDDFFHKLPFKDETLFVVLLCMGIVLPIIFITLFLIFFYKRRKENSERRQEMLLENQPEFSMDEYNSDQAGGTEDVPDLVLKNFSV